MSKNTQNKNTQNTTTENKKETAQRIERTVTAKSFKAFEAVAKSFVIRELHFHMAIDNVKGLETVQGEGTDDSVRIGQYGLGSNGKGELVSVWMRRKATDRKATLLSVDGTEKKEKHAFPCDFGVRFSRDDFKMFTAVTECKAIIDSAYNEHTEIKHNEPRFSFSTLDSVSEFLAHIYNAYETATKETAQEATKETVATETATA